MNSIKTRMTEAQKKQQGQIMAGWVLGWMKTRGCDMQEAIEGVVGDHHVDPDFWRDYVDPLLPSADDTQAEMLSKLKRKMEMEQQ